MKVKFKRLSKDALIPKKGTDGSAAYDLVTPRDFDVCAPQPGKSYRNVIPTDLAIALPKGYEAEIMPRSGLSLKGMIGTKVEMYADLSHQKKEGRFDCDVMIGKIDSDYRGNVGIMIHNYGESFTIPAGTRLAQMTIRKVEDVEWEEVDELPETERGAGGFGHTGTK